MIISRRRPVDPLTRGPVEASRHGPPTLSDDDHGNINVQRDGFQEARGA